MICEYGCNQEAEYQLKNGKWCCSKSTPKCPGMKSKFISVHNKKEMCSKCGKDIPISLFKKHDQSCLVNNCLHCNKPINKGKKFCSHRCSATYGNAHSEKYKNARHGPLPHKHPTKCVICGKSTSNKICCSNKCRKEFLRRNIESGKHTHRPTLKKYIIEQRSNKCEICNNTEWLGKPIPLVLDHIDGHYENNNLSNLRLVCGNCGMQLPTFAGRNKGNGRYYRRERYKQGKSS